MRRLGSRGAGAAGPDGAAPRRVSQLVAGLIALPLSALPFVGYGNLTPEGRLVRDRAIVALRPPSLPTLSPVQVAAARRAVPRYEGAVMALAYHGIGSASDGEGGFVVSPRRFGEHLATLKAAGMRTVTAAEVAAAFAGGPALPPNAVMISFDDGRSDAMLFADPLLAKAGMSATMFVITGAASKPGVYYASWDRLEDYARSGRWDLQAHTAEHHREHEAAGGGKLPALTSLKPGESLADYRTRVGDDLRRAAEAVERHTGRAPQALAYPFGAYGADRTNHPGIRQVLAEEVARRYPLAFHQDEQDTVPLVTGQDDRHGLRRLEVGDWSGGELLGRIAEAARRSGGAPLPPPPGPDPVAELAAPGPAGADPAPDAAPGDDPALLAAPAAPTARPTTTAAPATNPPARPAPASTVKPATTTTAKPATTTTVKPTTTTTVKPTTTTVKPTTTTTTAPPTTSTTEPGCRSHGDGGICRP